MNRFLFFINILFSGLLLFMSISYQFSIESLPILFVFSLFVPLLFFVNLIFLLFWGLKKSKKALLPLFCLLFGYFVFGAFYGIFKEGKEIATTDLKVMTYNAWGFNRNGWINDPNVGDKIIDFVKEQNPDILCLQEHYRNRSRDLDQFKYKSITPSDSKKTTQAIFSKYPILAKGSLDLPNTINNIIYVDVLMGRDTVRVYNIHLQSFKIVPSRRTFSEEESEKNYKRLVSTFKKQLEQAKFFATHRDSCPYPYIVCGDMNNTQFSNVYMELIGDLQDSFLEQGHGFGKTYSLRGIPLRIDYVMPDTSFEVIAHQNYDVRLSDHYPVMATLRAKSNP